MIEFKNLQIIPSYHSNLDFVHEVRRAFFNDIPDIVAVEFPENLEFDIMNGISRLPKPSLVAYFDQFLNSYLYIPIIGSDSLIEAIRLAQEYGIQTEFIDLFVKNYEPQADNFILPDSYALNELTLEEFYGMIDAQKDFYGLAEKRYNQINKKKKKLKNLRHQEEILLE